MIVVIGVVVDVVGVAVDVIVDVVVDVDVAVEVAAGGTVVVVAGVSVVAYTAKGVKKVKLTWLTGRLLCRARDIGPGHPGHVYGGRRRVTKGHTN